MNDTTRGRILDDIQASYTAHHAWNVVRPWIQRMVTAEPTVMRQVSRATFGDLGKWIQRGPKNIGFCGCLIGTVALKLVKARNHFKPIGHDGDDFKRTTGKWKGTYCDAPDVVTELARIRGQRMRYVGLEASWLGSMIGQSRAVAIIKDEIVRQLAARRRRRQKNK